MSRQTLRQFSTGRAPPVDPPLDPAVVIAAALTTVDWKPERKFIEPNDVVVQLILEGFRLAGLRIVPE